MQHIDAIAFSDIFRSEARGQAGAIYRPLFIVTMGILSVVAFELFPVPVIPANYIVNDRLTPWILQKYISVDGFTLSSSSQSRALTSSLLFYKKNVSIKPWENMVSASLPHRTAHMPPMCPIHNNQRILIAVHATIQYQQKAHNIRYRV